MHNYNCISRMWYVYLTVTRTTHKKLNHAPDSGRARNGNWEWEEVEREKKNMQKNQNNKI